MRLSNFVGLLCTTSNSAILLRTSGTDGKLPLGFLVVAILRQRDVRVRVTVQKGPVDIVVDGVRINEVVADIPSFFNTPLVLRGWLPVDYVLIARGSAGGGIRGPGLALDRIFAVRERFNGPLHVVGTIAVSGEEIRSLIGILESSIIATADVSDGVKASWKFSFYRSHVVLYVVR